MRGRTPVGPELAERLDGSDLARQRMRVVLETLAGTRRVKDACAELGICEQRFEALRTAAIRAGIEALELKPAGRPPRVTPEAEAEVTDLRKRVAELEASLQAALIRAELATTLPRVGADGGKKVPPRPGRTTGRNRPRSRPGASSPNP
jgi:hypothetical protein